MLKQVRQTFSHFNKTLFNSALSAPKIEIDLSRKFTMRYIDGVLYLGCEFSSLTLREFCLQILHEMIHIVNQNANLQDVGINQYHNKYFFKKCLEKGFFVVRHWNQGWSLNTTVLPRTVKDKSMVKSPCPNARRTLIGAIQSLPIDRVEFMAQMRVIAEMISNLKPPKTFFLKYVCKCAQPHNSIRSGRRPDSKNALDITCNRCKSNFICASDISDE